MRLKTDLQLYSNYTVLDGTTTFKFKYLNENDVLKQLTKEHINNNYN
jgi:hypothetical protein